MIKTAASPFRALSSLAGTNPESLEKLPLSFAQDTLDQAQRDILTKLATIMKKKPELVLELTQSTDPEKEKNRIAVQLTKAEFAARQLSGQDSTKVAVPEIKDDDTNLISFIRETVPAVDSLGIETACLKRLDSGRIETRFQEILTQCNRTITEFLTQNQSIPAESVQVETADLKNLPEEMNYPAASGRGIRRPSKRGLIGLLCATLYTVFQHLVL